ncbi:MAG: WecB/TagA/CpsF family glycosyltransferase [Methylocystaceae bacterium]|nr:WecB/TagA/CpsF family glycosyltransferase [Methylocystaceae bacterium]
MNGILQDGTPPRAKRRFGDFEIDCLSRDDLVDCCLDDISDDLGTAKTVMDVNGHGLSLARTDRTYREMVQQADIIHADGGFLVTLSRWFKGAEIPERSATTDMLHDFAKRFEETGHSFYLLGATEEVNADCAAELARLYPRLKIAGRRNGYFGAEDEAGIIAEINAAKPDVIWVGLGKPREQEIALRWRDKLDCSWIVTCGGCFNYVTGEYARAPEWMQRNNIEWVHRLVTNPRKLFWRYTVTTPHALGIALTQRG